MANKKTEPELPAETDIEQVLRGNTEMSTRIVDPQEASRSIMERILNADSVEDILAGGALDETDALLNRPFQLTGATFQDSTFKDDEGGLPVFAVIEGRYVDENGELGRAVKFSCGANTVVGQIVALQKKHALPVNVRLMKKDKPTRAGFYPLYLIAA